MPLDTQGEGVEYKVLRFRGRDPAGTVINLRVLKLPMKLKTIELASPGVRVVKKEQP